MLLAAVALAVVALTILHALGLLKPHVAKLDRKLGRMFWKKINPVNNTFAHFQMLSLNGLPKGPFELSSEDVYFSRLRLKFACIFPGILKEQELITSLKEALRVYPHFAATITSTANGTVAFDLSAPTIRFEMCDKGEQLPSALKTPWEVPTVSASDINVYDMGVEGLVSDVEVDIPTPLSMPLAVIRASHTGDGTTVLAVAWNHGVCDMDGAVRFMRAWGACARGTTPPPPCHERTLLKAATAAHHNQGQKGNEGKIIAGACGLMRSSFLATFAVGGKTKSLPSRTYNTLVTPQAAKALKDAILPTVKGVPFVSTHDILCAAFWKGSLKLRPLPPGTKSRLIIVVDVRGQDGVLPVDYWGNALTRAVVTATCADVLNASIGDIAGWVRAAVTEARKQPLSMAGFLNDVLAEGVASMADVWNNFDASRDMFVSSFAKFDSSAIDFGTGPPRRTLMSMKSLPWMVRVVPQPEGLDWQVYAPIQSGWDTLGLPEKALEL